MSIDPLEELPDAPPQARSVDAEGWAIRCKAAEAVAREATDALRELLDAAVLAMAEDDWLHREDKAVQRAQRLIECGGLARIAQGEDA